MTRARLLWALAACAALVMLVMSLPVRSWRTGRTEPPPPLPNAEAAPQTDLSRVWIDSDAACGHGPRVDPDDCLAIALLASSPRVHLAGVSAVFGNAALDVTDDTLRTLAARLSPRPPVLRGQAGPDDSSASEAALALGRALDEEPLTIIALGPLSNLAHALQARPARAQRIRRLIVVMGQRREHLFHPVEGGTAGSLFGHGPVFRDFNFAQDPAAAEQVLAQVPDVVYVPYEAARQVLWDGAALTAIAGTSDAGRWAAERSAAWLAYWRGSIGREGFMPFDALAAGVALAPGAFSCAPAAMQAERAPWLLRRMGIERQWVVQPGPVQGTQRYCVAAAADVLDRMLAAAKPRD